MPRNRYRRPRDPVATFWLAVLVIVVASLPIYAVAKAASGNEVAAVTVCEKERAATDGGGEYRVYTDKGTYVMKDVWFLGGTRVNTADDYGMIQEGVTYDISTLWYRFELLSWFPNIMEFEESAEQTPEVCNS